MLEGRVLGAGKISEGGLEVQTSRYRINEQSYVLYSIWNMVNKTEITSYGTDGY